MAKKHNSVTMLSLSEQVEFALKRGHFPNALEVAKRSLHSEPGPSSRALLLKVYLATVRDSMARQRSRDAVTILAEAEGFAGDDVEWLVPLAELRASLGNVDKAVALANRVPEGPVRSRIWQRLADWSLGDARSSVTQLPPELRLGAEAIRTAFRSYEEGRDDEARQLLQTVGLQSPFLEWKMLLRGLIAWSGGDDQKAAENWQRLDPERLPAQLVAPLRMRADPGFRHAQSPAAIADIERQAEQLVGGNLGAGLQKLRRALSAERNLGKAWNALEAFLPHAKQQAPQIVPRLQQIMYWCVLNHGDQPDSLRLARNFGPPPDDPMFVRCQALISEQHEDWEAAHSFWQKYEKWIEAHPERWPGTSGARARALIWERMATNAEAQAEAIEDEKHARADRGFLRFIDLYDDPRRQNLKPLCPPVTDCLRRAAELAPEQLRPLARLLHTHLEADETELAEGVARELIARFPEHLPTLEALADLHEKKGETAETLDYRRRCVQANPLDRRLDDPATRAAVNHARTLALQKQYDEARALLTEARARGSPATILAVSCLQETVERKAGAANPVAQLAPLDPTKEAAAAFHRGVEAGRLKLPTGAKKEAEAEMNRIFAASLDLAQLLPLLDAIDFYRHEAKAYRGLATHEKKVWALLDRALNVADDEASLVNACARLLRARAWKPLSSAIIIGAIRFKQNPTFPFMEAQMLLNKSPNRIPQYRVGPLLRKALDMAKKAKDGKYRNVEESIEKLRREHTWLEYHLSDQRFGGFNPFAFGEEDPW